MADDLRNVHTERHDLIEQLESLLQIMQKRDNEIQAITEVSFTHSLVDSFIHSLIPSFIHSRTHSFNVNVKYTLKQEVLRGIH